MLEVLSLKKKLQTNNNLNNKNKVHDLYNHICGVVCQKAEKASQID